MTYDQDEAAELVKSKFMKLNSSHIEFVFDCMKNNTTKIRNIKQYLKVVLFNTPNAIDSFNTSETHGLNFQKLGKDVP